jgi:hypothetical protein
MTSSESPVSETTERFLRAVVTRIPLERIEELHLFSPLRQGTVETGIAVVAALHVVTPLEVSGEAPPVAVPELLLAGEEDALPAPGDGAPGDGAPGVGELVEGEPVVRHTVYTARYRHVIKGPDRGKWEADVKAEADAPLVTVETVVRGVQRRAGEETAIVRYTASQLARVLRVTAPA